jgi:hypothetical protein
MQISAIARRIRVSVLLLACFPQLHSQNGPITLAYQFTHSENVDPSFSPEGQRMVYISVIAGKEQLFAMNLDGSQQHLPLRI